MFNLLLYHSIYEYLMDAENKRIQTVNWFVVAIK